MRRAFLERKIVRRRGDRQPVADPHLLMHELRSAAAAPVAVDRNHIAIGLPLRIDQRIASHQAIRSEEHTSELQSLMRISYAVFSLKKNITYTDLIRTTTSLTNQTNKT